MKRNQYSIAYALLQHYQPIAYADAVPKCSFYKHDLGVSLNEFYSKLTSVWLMLLIEIIEVHLNEIINSIVS